jgi:hypothetical protein
VDVWRGQRRHESARRLGGAVGDEQLNGDDLLASLTTDEWALVDADAMG